MAPFRAFSGALSHEGKTNNKTNRRRGTRRKEIPSDSKTYWGMFVLVTLLTDFGAAPFGGN